MTRKELLSELSRCAAQYGYPFKTGLTYRINTELDSLPVVWVEPPQLVARSGREEGLKEYRIAMWLIDTPATQSDRDASLEAMEESLECIISAISRHDEVLKTGPVAYSTEENTLSNRGDVSVKSVFTIKARY